MTVYTSDGSLLQRETTPGSGTYVTIPQVSNIKPCAYERKTQDVYTHDSEAPTTLTGGAEPQEYAADVIWDPGNAYHQAIYTDWTDKTPRNYRTILPDSGAWQEQFSAIVSKIERDDLDAEGKPLKLTVTFKLSGLPTITP